MTGVANRVRERLYAGELALGVGLRQARTVDVGRIMAACGYDFLFIDMEHAAYALETVGQIAVAALDAGIAPIVRVPGYAHHHASRALDAGALGIVFPHVQDGEQAARLAACCRFAPRGTRSIGGPLPQLGFASVRAAEATAAVNEATLVVAMVETPAAIDRVDEIAAAPGVDVVLVGTNDLCLEMGIPGEIDSPKVAEAYAKVLNACAKHSKWPGLGGVYVPELMRRYVDMGFRMILCGSDLTFLMAAARERAGFLRGLEVG
jgi:2-keto-3-deoxy-L-rhamnonate aldolase RhmA